MKALVVGLLALGTANFSPAQVFERPETGVVAIQAAFQLVDRSHAQVRCQLPPLSARAVGVARQARELTRGRTTAQRDSIRSAWAAVASETAAGMACYERYDDAEYAMHVLRGRIGTTYPLCQGDGWSVIHTPLSLSCVELAVPASLRGRYRAADRRHQVIAAGMATDPALLGLYKDLWFARSFRGGDH